MALAATDVRQVRINFGGEDYFESFPKLEKRGRIPKRERPNWGSTSTGESSIQEAAAAEEQQGKLGVVVEHQILVEESTAVEEKTPETAVADQEERETPQEDAVKSDDEEREMLEDVGFDELHKSDEELDREDKDWVVSVENPQESSQDVEEGATQENPAEERETLTDGDDDYLFFGTFRTLIPRPKISSESAAGHQVINEEEREAPVDEEREIIQENKMEEDVGVDDHEQQKSDDAQITTNNQETEESNIEEKEGLVSQLENFVENPQKPTTDDVEQGTAEGKETSERSNDEREVVAGGERENQDLAAAAVMRKEETQLVQKIVAEKEAISFGGKKYDDHFPKIERKQRITKRERRGEFQK